MFQTKAVYRVIRELPKDLVMLAREGAAKTKLQGFFVRRSLKTMGK
jgi:hypothetical protein